MKRLVASVVFATVVSACSNSNFRSTGKNEAASTLKNSDSEELLETAASSKSPIAIAKKTSSPEGALNQDLPASTSTSSTLGDALVAVPSDVPPSQIVDVEPKPIADIDKKSPDALITKKPDGVISANPGEVEKAAGTAPPVPAAVVAKTCGSSADGAIVADPSAFTISKAPRNDLCSNHPAQKKCVDGAWQPHGTSFATCMDAEIMSPRSLAIENEGPNRGTCVTDNFQDIDGFSGSYRLYCTTGHTNGVTNNAVSKVTFGWDQTLLPLSNRLIDFNIESFDGTGNFIFNVNDNTVRTCPSHSCGGSSLMGVVNPSAGNKFYFNVLSPCHQQGGCNTYGNMYMRVKYKYHAN